MDENTVLGITVKEAQAMLMYLKRQPYEDVFQFIAVLMKLKPTTTTVTATSEPGPTDA